MFIGREKEMKKLFDVMESHKMEFGILYGRRRVGKTRILKELCQRYSGIYFVASEVSYEDNMAQLSQVLADYYGEPIKFNDIVSAIQYVSKKDIDFKKLLVIDEFTYFISKRDSVLSEIQNAIDTIKETQSELKLILSGSQIGVMTEMIAYHSPLYARTTFRMKIEAFDYLDSSKFYEKYSFVDKIRTYCVFGGIPYYLERIDDSQSLKENIIRLILDYHSFLKDEVSFFLKQEFRTPSSYFNILNAVSSGATRLNEISTKAHVDNTGNTTKYLNSFVDLGIITKERCFGEKEDTKKTLYRITDPFFRFYFHYIQPNLSKLTMNQPEDFYDIIIHDTLDEYCSSVYEDVAKQYLIRKNIDDSLQNKIMEMNRYWYNNKQLKQDVEVDIVVRKKSSAILVYECKWTNGMITKSDAQWFAEKSLSLHPQEINVFCKSGIANDAKSLLSHVILPKDMYE